MAYLLDSNVFIDAKNSYYGFKLCPGFWKWLDHAFANNTALSVKKVRDELMARDDMISNWLKKRDKMFVDVMDSETVESMKKLSAWVIQNYTPANQAEFLGNADFHLVSFAHAHSHIVVTSEVAAYGAKVKIPNACRALSVKFMSPFEMLHAEKVQFHFNL